MRFLSLAAVMLLGACAHGPTSYRSSPARDPADSAYQKAVAQLDPANKQGTLDSALRYLDLYLASKGSQPHRAEAEAMRRLTRDAQQLARVEAALHQARMASDKAPAESKARDEESVKEIQRLKDELAKANEELERIRKRLAPPKPASPHSE